MVKGKTIGIQKKKPAKTKAADEDDTPSLGAKNSNKPLKIKKALSLMLIFFTGIATAAVLVTLFGSQVKDKLDLYFTELAKAVMNTETLQSSNAFFLQFKNKHESLEKKVDSFESVKIEVGRSRASLELILQRVAELEKQQQEIDAIVESGLQSDLALESLQSLNRIKNRLNRLEERDNFGILEDRIKHLEKAVNLSATSPQKNLETLVLGIEKRLVQLEKIRGKNELSDIVFGTTQLRSAIFGGKPFLAELLTLQGTDIYLDVIEPVAIGLEPLAAKGVKTVSSLKDDFLEFSSAIILAETREKEGWWETVKAQLQSLISVRRVESFRNPQTVEDRVEAAEILLTKGELRPAVQIIEQLVKKTDGETADRLTKWLETARKRILAEKLIADLYDRVLIFMQSYSKYQKN